jgi:two-component system, cell cycle sensor histidine kinase and response regulator CckA
VEADRARLAAILESSPSIIVALDTAYRLTDVNGAARRILGLTDADIGRYLGDVIDPRRTPYTPKRREELLSVLDGASVTFDTYLLAPDGSERTIDFTLAPIRAPDGTVAGISAIGRDATEERRAEEQRRRLAAIVESSRDPILTGRPDGTVVSWNGAAERAFGALAAEVVGRPLQEVLPAWLQEEGLRLAERVERGETVANLEARREREDRSLAHHVVSVFPIRDEGGALAASAVVVHEVTETMQLGEELAQARRLESLGRLAGGIAHDFNNLMAVIAGYGAILDQEVEGETAEHAVGEIRRAAGRAAELTAQLLAFSRRRPVARTTVDVAATVRGLQAMLASLLGDDVRLVLDAEEAVVVVADRAQLEQVVVNLALNARDALPGGGRVRIAVARVEEDGVPHACITVADTGSGMSPDLMDRIFEPFFTTKEAGRGTGLGLASVHGSVAQAGGRVVVESSPGVGTTFRVLLPAAAGDAQEEPEPEAGEADPPRGTETVLVCEDQDALRGLLERILTRAGYSVVAAADPAAALRIATDLRGAYDAVVSDVVMPGQSGLELAKELEVRHGTRPLVLVSGFNAESLDAGATLPAGTAFLEKPFESAELLSAVRSLLDGQAWSA